MKISKENVIKKIGEGNHKQLEYIVSKMLLAKKRCLDISSHVESYIVPLFLSYEFKNSRTGELLSNPSEIFLVGDDSKNEMLLRDYRKKCLELHQKNGYDCENPILKAYEESKKLENELVDTAGKLLGLDFSGFPFGFAEQSRFRNKLAVLLSDGKYEPFELPIFCLW